MSQEVIPNFETLIALRAAGEGAFAYTPDPFTANAPAGAPHEGAGVHGGMLALSCYKAAQEHLGAAPPSLRTLSIQYLSAPKYEEIMLRPRVLRAGRNITFVAVEAEQGGKFLHSAGLTFGQHDGMAAHRPNNMPTVETPEDLRFEPRNPTIPRHAALIEQKHTVGGTILGKGNEAVLRYWRRPSATAPLTAERLIFMMDAMAPPLHAVADSWHPCVSADLRYDFVAPISLDLVPDGWALFEWRTRDWSGGWTIDDCSVWNREGRLLAIGRQQRKMLG